MKPEVWLVSELYHPEETSTGYFVTGIAEGLAGEFSTGVICSQPTYSARGWKAAREETRNGVEVFRCLNTRLDPRILPYRLVNALTISAAFFFAVFRRVRRGNIVIVVTNPPTLPPVVRVAARLRGARSVLLVHDVYPEVLAAAGGLHKGGMAYRIAARLMQFIYRGFERVVVLGRDMRELVAQKIGATTPVSIIPNWADVAAISPLRGPNALLERLGISDRFVVQYAGNIGRTHGVDSLLSAAHTLKEDLAVHFLIIGDGARKRHVEREIETQQLTNVTILGTVPREELPIALNACDVAVISFVPGMKGVSVPSRMYNILAAGKPIIAMADVDSELGLVVAEHQAGWVVPPNDAEALLNAIREARQDREKLKLMGARGRTAVEQHYTRAHVISAWIDLIREFR